MSSSLTREAWDECVGLVSFYGKRGWDWRFAVEFHLRRAAGSLPWQEGIRLPEGNRRKAGQVRAHSH